MKRFAAVVLALLWAGCGKEPTPAPERVVPRITSPRSGALTGRLKVTVRGQAEPERALDVLVDGPRAALRVYSNEQGLFEAQDVPLGGPGGRVIWARMAHDTSLVSDPVVVTVDYGVLSTPVVLFPSHGARIPAGVVPLAGMVPQGVTAVEAYRNGVCIGTLPVDGGTFFGTLDPSGSGQVLVWTRGIEGTTRTAPSESITVTVGGGDAPSVLAITAPAQDTLIADRMVRVRGTASGSTILGLLVDGGDTGERTTGSGGVFSFDPVELRTEGAHVLGLVSLRNGGLVAEAAVRVFVDRTPPFPPAIVRPTLGEVYRTPEVLVEGASEPWARVSLAIDGEWLPAFEVGSSGAFCFPLTLPGDGQFLLLAMARDKAGNESPPSPERLVIVDRTAPEPPTLASPSPGDLVTGDAFVVSGTAQVGSWVWILVDGNLAREVPVASGPFEVTLPTPTLDGVHTVSLRASSIPAGPWVRGDSAWFSVDRTPPAPPLILHPPEGAVLSSAIVPLAGAAEPGATVTITHVGAPLASTTSDVRGSWRVDVPSPETDGPFTVQAFAVDTAGHTSEASAPHTVLIDRTPPLLSVTAPAPGELFSANPVLVTGSTEEDASVTVNGRVVPVVGTAFETFVTLREGPDTVLIQAVDPPGNAVTVRLWLMLDTTPPFITLTSPPESLLTQASSVAVTGSTEVGSTVTVQGSPVSVDETGQFTATVSLPFGWTTITVVSHDRAGWTTQVQRHVLRNDVPTAPGDLRPDRGAFVTTGRPTLAMAPSTDLSGSFLVHVVEVYADATLSTRVAQSPPLPAVGGAVTWVVVPEMGLTGGYRYWRARAYDGFTWGPWSAVATFRLPDVGARNPHRVLGYGDSITAGAQTQNGGWIPSEGYREELELALTAFFGNATVDTTWIPGGTSSDGVAQMHARLAGRPQAYLLLLFGTVDINQQVPLQTVAQNVATIASYARSLGMVVLVGTVPPRRDAQADAQVQQLNSLLRQLADGNGTLVADHYTRLVQVAAGDIQRVVCEDGIHPTDLGYSVMAEVWYETLTGSSDYPIMVRPAHLREALRGEE